MLQGTSSEQTLGAVFCHSNMKTCLRDQETGCFRKRQQWNNIPEFDHDQNYVLCFRRL